MSIVLKTVTPKHWIEIKYQGRTYCVGVKSLLDAWIKQNQKGYDYSFIDESTPFKEKEDGNTK